ncbi:prostatic acid phosphatase-like isoform X2 [Galleria mellonella]|uniref:acid phosphatase n=1 Tax=Galleria mellonella TaxID=7137 RepID=A0A6J3C0Y9_GALME|nr:prostatic acid phosphatase-like isoform X2 [Galleria mellonella]
MYISSKTFLLLVFFFHTFSYSYGNDKVRYAAVIYRHGDRTPVECYPTDPWRNESLWPVKFGQLTNIGKRQHFALGQWLRQRYSHLLSTEFEPTELHVRSTDVDRTLMSAQANLAGMYPPSGNSIWDNQLMWQPIPVHTKPVFEDNLLAMEKPCTTYTQVFNEYVNSEKYLTRLSKYKSLMEYLSYHTGENVTDYNDINNIYNTLYIEELYNFTLPNWTQSVYPDKLLEPACYSFTLKTVLPILARLKVGPLLKHIIEEMINIMKFEFLGIDEVGPRVSIFSGHDVTVANFLNALGMFDGKCPIYTSAVFMELLHETSADKMIDQEYFIRISYRNVTEIVEPHVLDIPHCGKKCPLEKFIKLYKHLHSVDWDYECEHQMCYII